VPASKHILENAIAFGRSEFDKTDITDMTHDTCISCS